MSGAVTHQILFKIKCERNNVEINMANVTELFPPQAFLLRGEGDAGQLGDRHHQDEGKITRNRDVGAKVRSATMQELNGEI